MTCNRQHAPGLQNLSRRGVRFSLFLLTLAGLGFVQPAPGQAHAPQDPHKPYALIFGTVWGPDNHPVYGVPVKIRRADQKKAKWELYSDHRGEFALRLPAGKADYVIWADLSGFKSLDGRRLQPGEEVTVHIESEERTDIGLHLK